MENEKYYTPSEIAKIFNFSPEGIRKWIKQGKLKAIRLGSRWRIPESALQEFLKDNNKE